MPRASSKDSAKKRGATPKGGQDEGGSSTRERLLEVAGQLFAEKGFDRTTSKEITEQAGANSAAVNYYFEGIEGIYAAVVEEAASLLVTSKQMQEVVGVHQDARGKLEAYLGLFVKSLTSPASSSWKLRILAREFSAPNLANQTPRKKERHQKISMLKGIVSDLMGLPEDHPSVARGCVSVLAPCFILLIGDRPTLKRAFPQLGLQPKDAPALLRHMVTYAIAGLSAVAAELD